MLKGEWLRRLTDQATERVRGGSIVAAWLLFSAVQALSVGASAAEDAHAGHMRSELGSAQDGGVEAPDGMTIQLVEPGADVSVEPGATVPVRVQASGMSVSGDHWHLYLDGELQAMVGGGRMSYELTLPDDIEAGAHELKVTISNASHQEYDLASETTIQVRTSGSTDSITPGK